MTWAPASGQAYPVRLSGDPDGGGDAVGKEATIAEPEDPSEPRMVSVGPAPEVPPGQLPRSSPAAAIAISPTAKTPTKGRRCPGGEVPAGRAMGVLGPGPLMKAL